MFRAAFHTGYVPCGVLRLTKAQLDGACSDARFDEEFFIDLIFAPIEKAGAAGSANASGSAVGVPTDSGLVIDATSADKYESSLHKDSRFWDAVSARKIKSKKRRSRKYLSSTADQFSIFDDSGGTIGVEEGGYSLDSIRFSTIVADMENSANGGGSGNGVSGMSDSELIMQLARAEEDRLGDGEDYDHEDGAGRAGGVNTTGAAGGVTPSSTTNTTTTGKSNVELQALEDLEKELGLDDLQLFLSDPPRTGTKSDLAANSAGNPYASPYYPYSNPYFNPYPDPYFNPCVDPYSNHYFDSL